MDEMNSELIGLNISILLATSGLSFWTNLRKVTTRWPAK
jgi:hypothetical protein